VFLVGGGAPVHLVGGDMARGHLGASRGVRHGPKRKGDDDATKLIEGGEKRRLR
jgi:hypothetical protein